MFAPEDVAGPPVLPEYGFGGGVVDAEYFGCSVDGKAVLHYHLNQHFALLTQRRGTLNGMVWYLDSAAAWAPDSSLFWEELCMPCEIL